MRCSLLLALGVLLTGACGPASPDVAGPPPGGAPADAGKPAAAGDVALEIAPIAIKGLVFEPEALGRPGMPLVAAKRKTTIEKQRAELARAKDPVLLQAQAAILATLLYEKSKTAQGDAQRQLLVDARQVLRDAAQTVGDKVDEVTLRLLGSYEILLEDYAAAEKAWAGLVNKLPKDKEAPYNRAWWAYSLLKQYKNAEALAVVKDEPPSDKQPELAYVTAWAKWRTHDDAGAWQAIVTAAKGWDKSTPRDPLDRDVLLFAGRSNVPLAQVTPQLFQVFGAKQKAQQYELLAKLGLHAYGLAGRWSDGVNALDKAVEAAGDALPPNDLPRIRYQQADFTVRLDAPEAAAKFAKAAIEALPKCGAKCTDKDKQDILQAVAIMGQLFHILYATANDKRFYQPAEDLYTLTMPLILDEKARDEVAQNTDTLKRTLKGTKPGTGTHDKGAVTALLQRHDQEVQACYEAQLAANPKVGGTVTVNLEVVDGAVKGVATEPKAGLADLSAVAGCIAEQAKEWKLPKRGAPGTTRIKLSYAMSPRK